MKRRDFLKTSAGAAVILSAGKARAQEAESSRSALKTGVDAETTILSIPRVSKPWSEALRLVGDGKTMYSDFGLILDKLGRWHCIGTFGTDPDGKGDGRALSDGYTLFHAVGDTLDAPMQRLDKIPYQVDSPRQAFMWAPGLTWDTEGERAFLYYFHYFGWEDGARVLPDEQAVRLLVSDSPHLDSWRSYDGPKLSDTNVVFRELDARDFRVFWDERLSVYLLYYCSSLASGPRVRTSSDLLHWSESVTVLTASPADPHGYAESPFVLYRDGYYYLWVSGIDYSHTSLYISEDPFNFGDAIENRIEDTPGHAPEIATVDGQDYMACSMVSTVPSESPGAHDLNGILVQPLRWDEADPGMEQRIVRKTQGE